MYIKYFKDCKNLIDCKTTYRKLSKEYHPDVCLDKSGTQFKEMKNEYDSIIKNPHYLDEKKKYTTNSKTTSYNTGGYNSNNYYKESSKEKKENKKSNNPLKDEIDRLIKVQKEKNYKSFWIYMKFIDFCKEGNRRPSLESFKYIASKLEYKEYWAQKKYEEFYQVTN